MGHISGDDADLHYEDGGHRWIPPLGADEQVWRERVAAHKQAHAAGNEAPRRSPRDKARPLTTGKVPPPTA